MDLFTKHLEGWVWRGREGIRRFGKFRERLRLRKGYVGLHNKTNKSCYESKKLIAWFSFLASVFKSSGKTCLYYFLWNHNRIQSRYASSSQTSNSCWKMNNGYDLHFAGGCDYGVNSLCYTHAKIHGSVARKFFSTVSSTPSLFFKLEGWTSGRLLIATSVSLGKTKKKITKKNEQGEPDRLIHQNDTTLTFLKLMIDQCKWHSPPCNLVDEHDGEEQTIRFFFLMRRLFRNESRKFLTSFRRVRQ